MAGAGVEIEHTIAQIAKTELPMAKMAHLMTPTERAAAYRMIYAGCEPEPGRFTSDLPINSEVWLLYATEHRFETPLPLLLTPHNAVGVPALRKSVLGLLPKAYHSNPSTSEKAFIAVNESHLLANISFFDLLGLLPLTRWWATYIRPASGAADALKPNGDAGEISSEQQSLTVTWISEPFIKWFGEQCLTGVSSEVALTQFKQIGFQAARDWFGNYSKSERIAVGRLVNVAALYVGLTLLGLSNDSYSPAILRARVRDSCRRALLNLGAAFESDVSTSKSASSSEMAHRSPLWQVSVNRRAEHAVYAARLTVKADAAIRVFDTGGQGIRWAVIDSGIDARHPAFADAKRFAAAGGKMTAGLVDPALSRVTKTLDFTRLATLTSSVDNPKLLKGLLGKFPARDLAERLSTIRRDLGFGRMIDWTQIEPLLVIDHDAVTYMAPVDSHGTHVAGIIGANWRSEMYKSLKIPVPIELADSTDVMGICPRIELLDLRVFPQNGSGDEFSILAALQYVRYLNQSKDRQYIHGINLSLSLRHEVRNYACGSTPVCLECDRLVGSGVVVVTAAGNYGYDEDYGISHLGGAYRGQSITDPGNAASVLTVGSTHRTDPYQYGISYFSSHGPTGDGRNKPDLVAPGEKIMSSVPGGGLASMDGTSMAAPHVSGVAALLLSRNNELMGHPARIKEILCQSASDLGRDRVFQGAGLVDALRALESV